MKTFLLFLFILFTAIYLFLPLDALGQTAPLEYYIQGYKLNSGSNDGNENYGSNPELSFSAVIEIPDAHGYNYILTKLISVKKVM